MMASQFGPAVILANLYNCSEYFNQNEIIITGEMIHRYCQLIQDAVGGHFYVTKKDFEDYLKKINSNLKDEESYLTMDDCYYEVQSMDFYIKGIPPRSHESLNRTYTIEVTEILELESKLIWNLISCGWEIDKDNYKSLIEFIKTGAAFKPDNENSFQNIDDIQVLARTIPQEKPIDPYI